MFFDEGLGMVWWVYIGGFGVGVILVGFFFWFGVCLFGFIVDV